MHQTEYLRRLNDRWCIDAVALVCERQGRRQGEHLYTADAVVRLSEAYKGLSGWTTAVGESLRNVLSTVMQPYIPPEPTRVGIFFRDWPVPCVDHDALAPEERGAARVPSDIMAGSIERVFGNEGNYATLRRGFNAAHAVARHLRNDTDSDLETFVRNSVVGDLVKLQALFHGMNGTPFTDRLSKRSCHTWAMYEFAGPHFASDLDDLGLDFVVGFGAQPPWRHALECLGRNGWRIHIPTDGAGVPRGGDLPRGQLDGRHFVLLPHPQARGDALRKAVQVLTRAEIVLPVPEQPSPPSDNDELDSEPAGEAPPDALYARVEEWLEKHFGGWEIEPHNTRTMRSFRPQGRRSGAIYNRTEESRKLVFSCQNREKWLHELRRHRVEAGEGRRIVIYIPNDRDLSELDRVLDDWDE